MKVNAHTQKSSPVWGAPTPAFPAYLAYIGGATSNKYIIVDLDLVPWGGSDYVTFNGTIVVGGWGCGPSETKSFSITIFKC